MYDIDFFTESNSRSGVVLCTAAERSSVLLEIAREDNFVSYLYSPGIIESPFRVSRELVVIAHDGEDLRSLLHLSLSWLLIIVDTSQSSSPLRCLMRRSYRLVARPSVAFFCLFVRSRGITIRGADDTNGTDNKGVYSMIIGGLFRGSPMGKSAGNRGL